MRVFSVILVIFTVIKCQLHSSCSMYITVHMIVFKKIYCICKVGVYGTLALLQVCEKNIISLLDASLLFSMTSDSQIERDQAVPVANG